MNLRSFIKFAFIASLVCSASQSMAQFKEPIPAGAVINYLREHLNKPYLYGWGENSEFCAIDFRGNYATSTDPASI
jgi:hypothetical protein